MKEGKDLGTGILIPALSCCAVKIEALNPPGPGFLNCKGGS